MKNKINISLKYKIISIFLLAAAILFIILIGFVEDGMSSVSGGHDILASILMPIFIIFSTFGLYFTALLLIAYISFKVAQRKKNEEAIFAFRFLSRLTLAFFIAYFMYWLFA